MSLEFAEGRMWNFLMLNLVMHIVIAEP